MPELRHVEEMVYCRSPNAGNKGSEITKWKFDKVRSCLLALLAMTGGKGVQASLLPDHVSLRLTTQDKARLGSVMWVCMMVQYEMEVSGEIETVPDNTPPRLRLKLQPV